MMKLTKEAVVRISQLSEHRLVSTGLLQKYIRIGIKDAGCSGYEYTFDFDNKILETDQISNKNNTIWVLVSEAAQPFLKGSTLDWIKEGVNERFKIINPNESSQCGCGVSVRF